MVARITIPNSIQRALNYNEKKVQDKKAKCIHAQNFVKEAEQLNFYDKLNRFEKLISLNERASTNTLHFSLNFDPSEKLSHEKLIEIANTYMERIGFGNQPYLVYEHTDAGHPHIHIVTTNIEKTGKRIPVHNIGRNASTKARKEIELKFGLVVAGGAKEMAQENTIRPVKLHYGKAETKRSITNVLQQVLTNYKFTSIAELNAILKLYNIRADRGTENSNIYKHEGLLYRVLNEKGEMIGVPIKASSFYNQPTLKKLQTLFEKNEPLKQEHKRHLKTTIDWIMQHPPKDMDAFKQALEKERISLVIRQNETGVVYGLTYIDHTTRCVFNGSDIGKGYSAKFILDKLQNPQQFIAMNKRQSITHRAEENKAQDMDHNKDLLTELTQPIEQSNSIPFHLRRRKKKNQNR